MTQHGEWLGLASSLVQPLPSLQALSSTWSPSTGTKVKSFTWSLSDGIHEESFTWCLNTGTPVYYRFCHIKLVPHTVQAEDIAAQSQHPQQTVHLHLDSIKRLARLLLLVLSNGEQQWDACGVLLKKRWHHLCNQVQFQPHAALEYG